MAFDRPGTSLVFQFSSLAKSEVSIKSTPSAWQDKPPVFLPTRELLTIYPGFVPLYETRHLEFDETWRDTCLLLGAPTLKGPREATIANLIAPLENQLGRRFVLNSHNDHFYFKPFKASKIEMLLVVEEWRKISSFYHNQFKNVTNSCKVGRYRFR